MPSHSPTDVTFELQVDGTYVSSYGGSALKVREKDMIRISRGVQDQQANMSPMTATFTLGNTAGLFTDDNPNSPLFGKLNLNSRCRLGVKKSSTWDEYLRMPDFDTFQSSQYAYTADKASLDITGDIDIRIEIGPYYTRNAAAYPLLAKWDYDTNNRSYSFWIGADSKLYLRWSTDGTSANTVTINSGSYLVPESTVRVAYRATLDVNNGAGGYDLKFYSSDTIDGSWTLIGGFTGVGVTSIFSGSANLTLGAVHNGSGGFGAHTCFRGKLYAAQVYSGIAGTLVADFRAAGKGIESTTWADACASPNTWILTGANIRLASDRIRFCGELSSLPDSWDQSENDLYVPSTAAGILSRYQNNKGVIGSALYRRYRNYGLTGYWPCEDATGSTEAANAISGGSPGKVTVGTFGAPTGLDGSAGALTLTTAPNTSSAVFKTSPVTNTGETTFIFYFKLPALPASDQIIASARMSMAATANWWTIAVGSTGFNFRHYDAANSLVSSASVTYGTGVDPSQAWVGIELMVSQVGGNVKWETTWHGVGSTTYYTHAVGGTSFAGTMRQFDNATFQVPDATLAGMQIAQVALSNDLIPLTETNFLNVSQAYTGETFGRRCIRLAEEEGEALDWLGDPDDTELVGPQTADSLFNIFSAGAKVDGAIVTDSRDRPGFLAVFGRYLGNRRGLSLNYDNSEIVALGQRVNDNRYVVNDFTASRSGGSSARYVADDDRPKNVRAPDDASPGVGRYELGETFAVADDDQLYDQASRRVHLGTWNERRIPSLEIAIHRAQIYGTTSLINGVIASDVGDPVSITSMSAAPSVPPEDLLLVSFGYVETIHNMLWSIVQNTVPGGPFQVPILGDYSGREPRMDNSVSEIHCSSTGITPSATSMRVRTPKLTSAGLTEPSWVTTAAYASEFPFDIMVNGERITVTAGSAVSANAMLINGDFEVAGDVANWLTSSCTFTSSTTFAHGGTRSGLITVTGAPTQAYVRPLASQLQPTVAVGDSLTLTGWVRSTALLADVRVSIDWLDENGVLLSTSDSGAAALASGAWASRTVTATAPASAAIARYGFTILSSPAAGTLLYCDDMTLSNNSVNYQDLTITRSVNGISKTHHDGDKPYLFQPYYLGIG